MNRRNLLKTFLAAPAIIRSGVLMPVVPLVAAPTIYRMGPGGVEARIRWSDEKLRGWVDAGQRECFDLARGRDITATWTVKTDANGRVCGFVGPVFHADPSPAFRLPKQSSSVYDLWGAAISEKAGRA